MAKTRPVVSVHVDIARFVHEVGKISAESSDKWLRSLCDCLAMRDKSLNAYGAFLLTEAETYKKAESDRKRESFSKDSQDKKTFPRNPRRSQPDRSDHKEDPPIVPHSDPWFESQEFQEAWAGWLAGRKKKATPNAEKLSLKKLHRLAKTVSEATAILNESIANGWTGIFPLDEGRPATAAPQVKAWM